MPQLSEVARFNRTMLPEELINNEEVRNLYHPGDNYVLAAEMVWAVLHAEALRQGKPTWVGDDNVTGRSVTGMGPIQATEILWPDLHKKERARVNSTIRLHLKASNNAKCLQQAKGAPGLRLPQVLAEWWIAEEFQPINLRKPSQAKRRTATKEPAAPKSPLKAASPFYVKMTPWPQLNGMEEEAKVNTFAADESLTHPREDYIVASRLVWVVIHAQLSQTGTRDNGGYRVNTFGWITRTIRQIWPDLSDREVRNAYLQIRDYLARGDLFFGTHEGSWIAETWTPIKHGRLKKEQAVVDAEPKTDRCSAEWTDDACVAPDDSDIELPTNGDPVVDAVKHLLDVVIANRKDSTDENAKLRDENRVLRQKLDAISNALSKL